jgi:putative transcriptional regulator
MTGKLLVSPPWVDDPHFARSVVLILAHTPEGAFGVVLNDESTTGIDTIADVVGPAWAALLAPPESIFVGGPCQTSSVIALGMINQDDARWEVMVVDLNEDQPRPEITRIRLFAGYAGWAPRQLESELDRGGWFVADASVEDSLTDQPDDLWQSVLARNGDPYARMPTDPRLN